MLVILCMAWLGPKDDHTFFRKTNATEDSHTQSSPKQAPPPNKMSGLFESGQRRMEDDRQARANQRRRTISIKYFAPQIIGSNSRQPQAIRSGSKLVGFLMTAIDTRHPSTVRVGIPRGGESSGVEIARGSILSGQFSYPGSGDRIFITFSQLDMLDTESKRVNAQALDSGTFVAGIQGEEYSGTGLKTAASLGLSMFSGMADVLTEKESLGPAVNGVQAKPTMKNALLQGLSHSAQDQSSRTASEIQSTRGYVLVPEGKEMIIELTEDFHK